MYGALRARSAPVPTTDIAFPNRTLLQWPLQDQTAVDLDDLAGDVARPVRGEKRHEVRDVLGGPEPPDRDLRFHVLQALLGHQRYHFGFDEAGRNGVDPDPVFRNLFGQRLGEGDDPAL